MSRYILIRPIHLSQKKYKNMHLEQIRSCGHKFLNCTRLEILTHLLIVIPVIRKHITAIWQSTWDESPLTKLHEIAPIVNEPRTHHLSTRRDQSVFNRCRIGHSRLTHEFLLKGEPPPECIPCNCPLTIKHLLIECVDFNDVRQRFYQVPTLQDLFKTVKPEVILDFLKAAALYRLL